MTFRRLPRLLTAATALAALTALTLTACTPAVGDESRPAATATPAAMTGTGFACPPADQLASRSAMTFERTTATTRSCTYEAEGDNARTMLRIEHGASGVPGVRTLKAQRTAEQRSGATITSAADVARGAFTAQTSDRCTAWSYAADGVLTSVTATGGDEACAPAKAAAVLTGTADRSADPLVTVIASKRLPTKTLRTALTDDDLKVDDAGSRANGFTDGTGFTKAAEKADPTSAAVVFIPDASDATPDRLTIARAASAALSAASLSASQARLFVVAPVRNDDTDRSQLVDGLRAATLLAHAPWLDPGATTEAAQLTSAAKSIEQLLEAAEHRADAA